MSAAPSQYVTFETDTGLKVSVLGGESGAIITGGYGGWEVVSRPKRVGAIRFSGHDPFRQDITIRFDGLADAKPCEHDISTLERMAEQPSKLAQPPKVRVSGPVPRRDLTYVIENLTWDASDAIWKSIGGVPVRLRQGGTVSLLQYVEDSAITSGPSPAQGAGGASGGSKVVSGQGKSAKDHSQEQYGTPDGWLSIINANPFLIPDPRAPIPATTQFVVPKLPSIFGGS